MASYYQSTKLGIRVRVCMRTRRLGRKTISMPIQFNHLGHASHSPPTGGGFGTKMQSTGTLLRVGNTEMQPSATHKPVTSKAYRRGPVTGGLPLSGPVHYLTQICSRKPELTIVTKLSGTSSPFWSLPYPVGPPAEGL